MPYCAKCGTQLPDDARFCDRCGTPLGPMAIGVPAPTQAPPAPQGGFAALARRGVFMVITFLALLALVKGAASVLGSLGAETYKERTVQCLAQRNGIFKDQIQDMDLLVKNGRGAVVHARILVSGTKAYALLAFTRTQGDRIDDEYHIRTREGSPYTQEDAQAMAISVGILDAR